MGGDPWGRAPSRLGQTYTYTQLVQILKAAVTEQNSLKNRNDRLPPEYQLDPAEIAKVDQAIQGQQNWITGYDNEVMPKWIFWDTTADPDETKAALNVQSLVQALDQKERGQEAKAGEISQTAPGTAPAPGHAPASAPTKNDSTTGSILAVMAAAAFAAAVFVSTDNWKSWPWQKSPYEPPSPAA